MMVWLGEVPLNGKSLREHLEFIDKNIAQSFEQNSLLQSYTSYFALNCYLRRKQLNAVIPVNEKKLRKRSLSLTKFF